MELLAPAKNLTSAKAVFSCGADAVYFGGKKFGARAYADNFDENEILSLIDYAHIFGKRAYMTVNTLLKDAELERMLYQTIEPLYRHGLDAVLVQDFGVFSFLRQHFPELPIHTSTQMNVTSRHGAALLKNAGASRIVLARELSIAEMAAIHEAVDVEFEVFVHGALCVCYSGQCLMSSMIGGRSGNRGACGQACRLAYEVKDAKGKTVKAPGAYPLSPKDLCGIDDLYALKKAGVASLKIEGRMKSLSYAAAVTEVYREYIDRSDEAQYFVEEKDRRRLLDAGNRNGFTNAYYYRRNDTEMMAYTNSAHKRSAEEEPQIAPLKLPVSAKVSVLAGAPLSVSFYAAESVPNVANVGESHGATPLAAARTKPTSEADIISKLQKTGDYPFVLTEVTVDGADTSFVPMKELNEVRRQAMDRLMEELLAPYRRKTAEQQQALQQTAAQQTSGQQTFNATQPQSRLSARIQTKEQLMVCAHSPIVDELIVHDDLWDVVCKIICDTSDEVYDLQGIGTSDEKNERSGTEQNKTVRSETDRNKSDKKRLVFALPTIIRQSNAGRLASFIKAHPKAAYEADSYDGLGLLFACGIAPEQIRGGMRLYAWSNRARQAFYTLGIHQLTVPVELSFNEIRHRDNAQDTMIIYGRYPLMYTANCVNKGCYGCDKKRKTFFLTDKKGYAFPVINDCTNCTNVIYNSRPLSLFSEAKDVKKIGAGSYEISFVTESEGQTRDILKQYAYAFLKTVSTDAQGADAQATHTAEHSAHKHSASAKEKAIDAAAYTKGHFRRGVKE